MLKYHNRSLKTNLATQSLTGPNHDMSPFEHHDQMIQISPNRFVYSFQVLRNQNF